MSVGNRLFERERKVDGYVGQTRVMNCGIPCTVIEYIKYTDIIVKFDTGEIRHCRVNNFLDGTVACKNDDRLISQNTMHRLTKLANKNNLSVDACLSAILDEYIQ